MKRAERLRLMRGRSEEGRGARYLENSLNTRVWAHELVSSRMGIIVVAEAFDSKQDYYLFTCDRIPIRASA